MKDITEDLPRLQRIVASIHQQSETPSCLGVENALVGLLTLSVAILRSNESTKDDIADALRYAIQNACTYLAHKERPSAVEPRVAADMSRMARLEGWEMEFRLGLAARPEWAYRLKEMVDQIAMDEARGDADMVRANLAHLITMCTLWVALILDGNPPTDNIVLPIKATGKEAE